MNIENKTQCKHWEELEFREADQLFDHGEWSAAWQDETPMENPVPCGTCDVCLEAAKYDAEHPDPPDEFFDGHLAVTVRP